MIVRTIKCSRNVEKNGTRLGREGFIPMDADGVPEEVVGRDHSAIPINKVSRSYRYKVQAIIFVLYKVLSAFHYLQILRFQMKASETVSKNCSSISRVMYD